MHSLLNLPTWLPRIGTGLRTCLRLRQRKQRSGRAWRSAFERLEYRIVPSAWSYTGSLNISLYDATATLLSNGEVLVAGDDYNTELYSPATGVWSGTGSLNTARYEYTATLLNNGEVLVAGGYNDSIGAVSSAELYNPATGIWSTTGSLNAARMGETATLLNNGEVLVAGGYNGSSFLSSAELYNPSTGVWSATDSLNTARDRATATLLNNGQVLVASGQNTNTGVLASAELYNPSTGVWSTTASMNTARLGDAATLLNNGEVLVEGGEGGGGPSSAELYNPGSPTSTALTDNGPNPSTSGQSVSFTVSVSPTVPNGETVYLEDASNGNAVVGSGTLTNGSATVNVSSLAVGSHNIFAVYGGDSNYIGSSSSQATQTVNQLWNNFNGNPQHTGISTVAAQPMDQILWQTSLDQQGTYFWHTGEPVFTPDDTVIVPIITSSGDNFEVKAFNGATGALLWTAASSYIQPSYSWLPPYQPVYDPVTDRVYFAGPGGTLYYISHPDSPSSLTPVQVAFYGTTNYTANESAYNSSIYINTPLTVDNSGNVFFGFTETGSNPSAINDGGIGRVSATGAGTYVTTGVAVGVGSGGPAIGSAPALNNGDSTLYVAINDTNGPYLVGVHATTLAPEYAVALSVPNSGTGVELISESTAAPMVAPDGTVFMGVFADNYDGSRGFMTHYSANLATEYTPGAFGWDDTASIIPTSMVPSYTGNSPYLILTKYNNYVAAETGSSGGNGVNEIAVLDPYATQTDPNNDPNPSMLVMKQILTVTSPTEDSGYINGGYPDATREWCTNGTAVDPSSDSVFINNEDGYSYRWNLATDTITQAVEITDGYGEPYTPTAIGPNGVVYAINGGTLFALGGYTNYTLTNVSTLTPAVVGQSVTFTTTLASTNGGAVPTGSITYTYTSGVNDPLTSTPVTLGAVPLVNGQAIFTTSALVADHYHIIATYSGDATDGYAAGSTTLVQVVLANPTTTVTSSASPVNVGASVTFTATVNPQGVFFVPLGTVSFMDGNTLLGTVKLNALDQSTSPSSSQVATFTTSSLSAGSHAITALYSGDLNFAGSTSSTLTQAVLIPTTTSLSDSGPNPSTLGQNVAFVVTVSPTVLNGEIVNLEDASNGNAVVGSGTLTSGTVTINVSNLAVGTHSIVAVYAGDSAHAGSQSSAVSQGVNNAPPPAVTSVIVNGGTPQYTDSNGLNVSLAGQNSVVEQILVTFNEAVTLSPGAFTITNDASAVTVDGGPSPNTAAVSTNVTPVAGSGNTQFIVTFSGAGTTPIPGGAGNVIEDGLYILNTVGANIAANGQHPANRNDVFWALYGSASSSNVISPTLGDGNSEIFVDTSDFALFHNTFGSESDSPSGPPVYNVAFDSNLDGYVDTLDFSKFHSNFGADWAF